jgi:hypothetical protein
MIKGIVKTSYIPCVLGLLTLNLPSFGQQRLLTFHPGVEIYTRRESFNYRVDDPVTLAHLGKEGLVLDTRASEKDRFTASRCVSDLYSMRWQLKLVGKENDYLPIPVPYVEYRELPKCVITFIALHTLESVKRYLDTQLALKMYTQFEKFYSYEKGGLYQWPSYREIHKRMIDFVKLTGKQTIIYNEDFEHLENDERFRYARIPMQICVRRELTKQFSSYLLREYDSCSTWATPIKVRQYSLRSDGDLTIAAYSFGKLGKRRFSARIVGFGPRLAALTDAKRWLSSESATQCLLDLGQSRDKIRQQPFENYTTLLLPP